MGKMRTWTANMVHVLPGTSAFYHWPTKSENRQLCDSLRSALSNWRPAGHIRPAELANPARECP